MKAASSEWYTTTSRHALPLPPSLTTSAASSSRDHHRSRALHDYAIGHHHHQQQQHPKHHLRSSNELSSSKYKGTYDASSSLQTISTESRTFSPGGHLLSSSFSKSESVRGGGGEGSSASGGRDYGESRRRRKLSATTTPTLPSFSSTTSESFYITANSDKYKEKITSSFLGYPSTFSYDSRLSFPSRNLSDRFSAESEFSDGERALGATTTEVEGSVTEVEESDQVCTAEEEDSEDDENVYRSFKQSLMMLHPTPQLRFKSPSVSPAVSLRSVITELEEDEEDLPPEQVEEDLNFTTEEDEGEDYEEERRGSLLSDSSGSFSHSYYRHVPKSPVKVRVKVEKATPDKDDKVKVTVHFEDEYESDEDASAATTSTADTVRRREATRSTEESGSDDEEEEEEEEDGSHSQNSSDSDNSLSEEENESERSNQDKTESHILTTNPTLRLGLSHGNSSTGTQSQSSGCTQSTSEACTGTTTHSKEDDSEKKGSDTGSGETPQSILRTSSHSSNSSRSHSARSSPVGRSSARHKMYMVGGKIRSLSARMRALPHPLPPLLPLPGPIRQNTYTLQALHEDESSEHSSYLVKTGSTSSNSDTEKPFSKLSRYATFTLPEKSGISELPLLPTRCHSASYARNRQFCAALAQLSHGDLRRTAADDHSGLPPISSKPSTESSTSSGSLTKPRPLVRNLTYTICSHSASAEEEYPPPTDLSHLRRLSEMEHSVNEYPSEVESKHLLFSEKVPFDSIYSIGNLDQQRFNDLIALSKVNREHQESFLFPPLNWTSQNLSKNEEPGESFQLSDSLLGRGNSNSGSSSASSATHKARKVQFTEKKPEDNFINKDYLTYSELMREPIGELEPGSTNERLKKFALAKIRKQIDLERKRLQSIELEGSGNDNSDDDDDDDDDDGDDESSEDEDTEKRRKLVFTNKFKEDNTHIPMPSAVSATGGADPASTTEQADPEPESEIIINQTEGDFNWSRDMKKNFEDEEQQVVEEKEPTPPFGTRPNSAESGYRAMPPSRVTSRDISREQSIDQEELEKEKDRILEEWRKSGAEGAPPTIPVSIAGSSSSHLPFAHHINTDSNSYRDPEQDKKEQDPLIQGDIDLTKEIPGEEKKIAFIWEEFNRDERSSGGMVDYEFSTLLDEMIMDVNSYKPQLSNGVNTNSLQSLQVSNQGAVPSLEPPKFDESRKYQTLSEMISLLSHNLRLVSSETLEDHMASLISLLSSVLKKVRKNKVEDDYFAQISCLSAIRVLCDRIQEMQSSQNLKYADLSWLFRILCKYSSDTESKIRSEASFCLARLVKVAGPALVVRPIYFILVMESEGGGGKTTTGAKTKAAAIDTLTYALLTFAREEFHNLEEIAGWVCLAMLNEERRIRQSALECLAVISQHLGGREKAIPLFHTLFLKEELDHFSRSPSPESVKTTKTGKSGKSNRSDPIPLSVHGTVRLLTGPGFPIAQPIDAITARLDKDVLPVPSTKGLIEYAVNVPTGKDLVLLMTHMLDKDDDEWDFSSSTDSLDSGKSAMSKRSSVGSIGFSDIDWTGEGTQKDKKNDEDELISPDVAYILLGKGRVNKQEVVLLDTYKKEIIPEIIEMLNRKHQQGKGRNKKKWAKLNKKKKRKRRKGQKDGEESGPPLIPTLSFDCDDGVAAIQPDEESGEIPIPEDDEIFGGGPTVVVDPPEETSLPTEDVTQSSTNKS